MSQPRFSEGTKTTLGADPTRRTVVKAMALSGSGVSMLLTACGGGAGGSGDSPSTSAPDNISPEDGSSSTTTPDASSDSPGESASNDPPGGPTNDSSSPSPDNIAPTLVSQVPIAGSTNVARGITLELTFSEPVSTGTGALTLTGPHGQIPVDLGGSGPTLTIKPQRVLRFGEVHTLKVNGGVVDAAGNSFAGTTRGFTTLPRNPALGLGGTVMDSYVRRRWAPPDPSAFDPIAFMADKGMGWLRVGVTTNSWPELRATDQWHTIPYRSGFWSSLEVSGALLREGAKEGLRLHAMLYLSDGPAEAGRQPRPAVWAGLSESEVARRLELHAAETAAYYQSLGLNIEVFEVGNELDFGVCGIVLNDTVPTTPGVDAINDSTWMRNNVWILCAPLLAAAIRGVRAVYPTARVMLHVAGMGYSRDNVAASAFFESMIALGVPFDIAGLSYPNMFGGAELPQPYFAQAVFQRTLTRIAALGRPLQIVEFGYQATSEGALHAPSTRYPFTPQGQADFVRDFAGSVWGRVESILYFCPDWVGGQDKGAPELGGLGLFSAPGVPRPAWEVFNDIAEARVSNIGSLAPNLSPSPIDEVLDLLARTEHGAWVKLNTNRYQDIWPPNKNLGPNFGSPARVLAAWSSFGWDTKRHRLYLWGGGHANTDDAALYCWDAVTRQWIVGYYSQRVVLDPNDGYMGVDGHLAGPVSSHCYANNNYLPAVDRFVTLGGAAHSSGGSFAVWASGGFRNLYGYLCELDLVGKGYVGGTTGSNWQRNGITTVLPGAQPWRPLDYIRAQGSWPSYNGISGGTDVLVENGKDVMYIVSASNTVKNFERVEMPSVDPVTHVHSRVGRTWSNGLGNDIACAVDRTRRVMFLAGTGGVRFWDIKTASATNNIQIPILTGDDAMEFEATCLGSRKPGAAADPVAGIYVWCWGGKVFKVTPPEGNPTPTDNWLVEKVADATEVRPKTNAELSLTEGDGGYSVLGKWRYAADLRCFLGLQGAFDGDVWAWKPHGWIDPRT